MVCWSGVVDFLHSICHCSSSFQELLFHEMAVSGFIQEESDKATRAIRVLRNGDSCVLALIERRLRGDEGSVPNALAIFVLARAGSDNYPQNAALWFLPCLFVTGDGFFLGFFLLVNKRVLSRRNRNGGAGVIGLPSWRLPWSVSFRSSSCGPLTCRSISSDFRGLLISCPSPCCSTASVLAE